MPISWKNLETTLLGQHADLALAILQAKIKFSYHPPENPDTGHVFLVSGLSGGLSRSLG